MTQLDSLEDEYLFSSQLETLVFEDAGSDPVRVCIVVSVNNVESPLIDATYYPVNECLYFYDFRELFEEYMRQHDLSEIIVRVELYPLEGDMYPVTFGVVFCGFNTRTTCGAFLQNRFLTSIDSKRIPAERSGVIEDVTAMFSGEESVLPSSYGVTAEFVDPDGDSVELSFSKDVSCDYGLKVFYTTYEEIYEECARGYNGEVPFEELELKRFTLSVGNRNMEYFLDGDFQPQQVFRFRNVFNITEYVYFEADTIIKSEAERSVATSHGVSMFYDQEDKQEYVVTTAPMTSVEAVWAQELLFSRKVERVEKDGALTEVLITDMTSEVTDSDKELIRLKFTYRMTHNGATLPKWELQQEAKRVFAMDFDLAFS